MFEDEWGKDESPIGNVEITTTMLYFSREELRELKKHTSKTWKRSGATIFA